MTSVLLIIHLFVTLALIGVVLIQRSEGGGLGIGSSQGMGSFMGGRGTANLLTRTTAILAAIFMALSLTLALLNRGTISAGRTSILDHAPGGAPISAPLTPPVSAPGGGSSVPSGVEPAKPGEPASPTPGAASGVPPAPRSGPTVPTN